MSTRMGEGDWDLALAAFRASAPRRGGKGRDDRLFLEALHFFAVHNIIWRALPERFGEWSSVWRRFDRLSRSGTFEMVFEHLASLSVSAGLVQMFDSAVVRAHVPIRLLGRAQRGARGPCPWPFARGLLDQDPPQDRSQRPDPRLRSDRRPSGGRSSMPLLMDLRPQSACRAVLADKGYDSAANRKAAKDRGAVPIIPHRRNAKSKPKVFPKLLSSARARIEQAIGKLKRFKRIALRCEKTARNFRAFVEIAAAFISIKFVHTP